jgi:uncharacterized membrane protein
MKESEKLIKQATLEQYREKNFGLWLRNWLELNGGIFRSAFTTYRDNLELLLSICSVALLVSLITFGLLMGPMLIGVYVITFRLIDKSSPAPNIKDLLAGFDDPLTSILYGLVCVLAIGGLFVAFDSLPLVGTTIAYAYLAVTHSLVFLGFPLIAEKKLKLVPAFTESFAALKKHHLPLATFSLVALVLGLCGILAYYIGLFLTLPLYFCLVAHCARKATEPSRSQITQNLTLGKPVQH